MKDPDNAAPGGASGKPGRSLTARIIDAHGKAIVSGAVAAGDIIDRGTLPAELSGASRNVWREAIQALTVLGLVAPVKRKGTVVLPESEWLILNPQLLEWITEVGAAAKLIPQLQGFREIIEPAAAHAAAKHRTPSQLAAIEAALAELADLADSRSDDSEIDIRFHIAVVEATGNRLFLGLGPTIEQALRLSLSVTLKEKESRARRRQALDWHRQVVEAIRRRDAEGAHAAMYATIVKTYAPWKKA